MLERRKIRTILNTTDTSSETQSPTGSTIDFVVTTSDAFYVGYHAKFASRYFLLDTVNSNSLSLVIEYWDGDAWTAVSSIIDQTSGFTESGFVSWINESDWAKTTVTGVEDEIFWVKITVSGNMSAGSKLESVLNLFSDDALLRAYYPDIVADTRFLPPSRTSFIEQHLAAKNLVVQRLTQKRVISEESQIIDINQVAVAAVHALSSIILAPIAQSDQQQALLQDSRNSFERELSLISFDVDVNKDGILTDAERSNITTGWLIRR